MEKERTVQLGVITIHCTLGCLVQPESESGVSKQSGVLVLSLATIIFHGLKTLKERKKCTAGCYRYPVYARVPFPWEDYPETNLIRLSVHAPAVPVGCAVSCLNS